MASTEVNQTNNQGEAVVIDRKIPVASVAVMIFILLVAFACVGVQVVFAATGQNDVKEQQASLKPGNFDFQEAMVVAELPEGIAGSVNGEEIPESEITDYITNFRHAHGLDGDDAWIEYLIEYGYTPQTVRESVISAYMTLDLDRQLASQNKIVISEEEGDAIFDQYIDDLGGQEELDKLMAETGYSEYYVKATAIDTAIREMMKDDFVKEKPSSASTDASILVSIQASMPEYADAESLDEIPADIVEKYRKSVLDYEFALAFSKGFNNYASDSELYISEMPADVPYNVNVELQKLINQFQEIFPDELKEMIP